MSAHAADPSPRKGLLLRLLRILAWLLMAVSIICVALYLAFGPANLIERLRPPPPVFPENVVTEPELPTAAAEVPAPVSAPSDSRELVKLVMESVEDIWGEFLARGDYAYKKPRLELYEGRIDAACKRSEAASGSFYCMPEKRIYMDIAYLDELQQRAPEMGDFTRTYVVAHQAAHHVQNLVGMVAWIKEYGARGELADGAESIEETQELVADCLVGSWAAYAQRKYPWLKPGDIEGVLKTVVELGKERATRPGQPAMPDSLTAGSIEARARWFRQGTETGDPRECGQLFGGVAQ